MSDDVVAIDRFFSKVDRLYSALYSHYVTVIREELTRVTEIGPWGLHVNLVATPWLICESPADFRVHRVDIAFFTVGRWVRLTWDNVTPLNAALKGALLDACYPRGGNDALV